MKNISKLIVSLLLAAVMTTVIPFAALATDLGQTMAYDDPNADKAHLEGYHIYTAKVGPGPSILSAMSARAAAAASAMRLMKAPEWKR